ncbi:hypothetical protein JCM9279_004192 [Rhodotorula babjevae]
MRTSTRATAASASASPPSPVDGKAAAESFSYVEPPTTRFVAELPVVPAPPPPVADPAAVAADRDPLLDDWRSLGPASTALAPPLPAPRRAMQPNDAPTHAPGAPPGPSPVPSSSIASDRASSSTLAPTTADREGRAASKSRRRLTASLGNLLPGTKRDKARAGEPAPAPAGTSASAAGSSALAASTGSAGPFGFGTRSRRSSSASRHPVLLSGSAVADSASPYSLPTHASSTLTSTSSKPPVTLAKVFRRRNSGSHGSDVVSPTSTSTSSSLTPTSASPPPPPAGPFELANDPRRPSLDELTSPLRLSDSSEGSASALTASGSAVSTAPTSPDAPACDEDEAATAAERRRRGSLALAEQLSRDGREDEVEDLHDFVVASGSPKPSSTPFARRPSNAPSLVPFSPAPDFDPSRSINTSGASSPPLHPRRLTRNIEGLSLSDLRRSPSETPSPAPLPSQTAAPFAVTSSSPPEGATPAGPAAQRDSSTRGRLGALPRLLSTNAVVTAGATGETESETDTEGDSDSSEEDEDEDEGDHYATGDEGPITTRSPVGTPAAHTPAASAYGTPRGQTPGAARPPTARMPSLSAVSISTATGVASGGPSNWVSFAHTPTPAMRTARPQNGISYFDLPRPTSSSLAAAAGGPSASGAPPKTPLAFMSMSDVARGKRPALQEDVDAAASAAASPARIVTVEPTAAPTDRTGTAPASPTTDGAARAGLYRLRSQSVVALASPRMLDEDGEPLGTAGVTELDPVWQRGVPTAQKTPGFLSFGLVAQKQQQGATVSDELRRPTPQSPASPIKTPAPLDTSLASSPSSTQPSSPTTLRSRPTTAGAGNRLHRTRSMYELRDAPPAYTSMYRQSGTGMMQVILPREEEGREGLPGYSCAIHIEGYMPRKLEFTAPGVQARDRAWKRQYFVLHGTSIKIFKFDLRTHPLPGEDDWSVVPADIAGSDGPPPLHFHEGEYGVEQPGQGHRFSIELAKAKAKERIIASATASADNALVRHYSLQNAESGLAADYLKRKHVVRVRAEGEQFLLQAKDDRGVIDLIEALQAATNVALDLDARPLPKFITLPRRRRRRRAARPADGAAAAAAGTNGAAATDSTAAASAAAAAPAAPDRMGDMLAEEQNAYSRRNSATVM